MPRVELFATPRIRHDSHDVRFLPDKRHQCLAYLAARGEWVSREMLATLFWPQKTTAEARHSLRQLLKRIRKLDYARELEAERDRVRWPVETDVQAFREALAQRAFDSLPALYAGAFLEGLETRSDGNFLSWLEHERAHLHSQYRQAMLTSAQSLQETHRTDQALSVLNTVLARDPLDEEALQALLRVAVAGGQRQLGLGSYQRFTHTLRHELELEPSAETEALARALADSDFVAGGGTADAALPAAARTSLSSFVGRELELSELIHRLARPDCRLLTVVGVGGIGKSRLVQEAGDALRGDYPDGVYFVPLDILTEAGAVPGAIANALNAPLTSQEQAVEQLAGAIAERRLLLILDNFEHLMAAATLVAELIHACPRLDVLATSREVLKLEEEWLLALEGLGFPDDAAVPLDDALHYDAIRLFGQRAQRLRYDFEVTPATLPHVVRIAQLVRGSPLGLELAAAWVRLLPVATLAAEIARTLDFLESGSRNRLERHASLRAAFEHSWELLTPTEQTVLRKLSVFRGGFRREAAAAVTGASVAVLAALADKSLLRSDARGRFDRHPLIYQYTLEKLQADPDELARLEAAHAGYFHQQLRQLHDPGRREELNASDILDEEWENHLTAMAWSVRRARSADMRDILGWMPRHFRNRGRLREGLELYITMALALQKGQDRHRQQLLGRVLLEQAWYEHELGQLGQATDTAERGLAIMRSLGDTGWQAHGLNTLGSIAWMTGDYRTAKRRYEVALPLAKRARNHEVTGFLLGNLGALEKSLGNYQQAKRLVTEALELNRRLDRPSGIIINHGNLGTVHMCLGEWQAAKESYQEGLRVARANDIRNWLPFMLGGLGGAVFEMGRFVEARSYFQEALELAQEFGDVHMATYLHADLSLAATALADDREACSYCDQAIALGWKHQLLPNVLGGGVYALAEWQAKQGRDELAAHLLYGIAQHPQAEQETVDGAHRSLDKLATRLSPETLREAEAAAQDMPLEQIVETILQHGTAAFHQHTAWPEKSAIQAEA